MESAGKTCKVVFGFNINLESLIEESPEILILLPAVVFGYLFYLTSDLVFLQIGTLWAISLSMLAGLARITGVSSMDIYESTITMVFFIYGCWIGPLAIFAALNNLLPERQEIRIFSLIGNIVGYTGSVQNNFVAGIVQGTLAAKDPILLFLFGAQVISYMYIFGSIVFFILIGPIYWILKRSWDILWGD